MLSASPHRKANNYSNWKANKYSILTVTELGTPVSESLTGCQNFMLPTESEHKSHNMGIENGLPIEFNLRSSWSGTCSHNHYTMFNH